MDLTMQILSLAGAALILGAYVALQRRWWSSRSAGYLWLNLLGALMLTVVAFVEGLAGFVILESAWAAITLTAMFGPG